jgi:hypothetical protein
MDNSIITATFFAISFLGAIPILQIFFFRSYRPDVEGIDEISVEFKGMDINSMYALCCIVNKPVSSDSENGIWTVWTSRWRVH